MPVSPRDFELYSRMTGAPMPSDPMSRMQMAPAVYDFTKNLTKKPNLLEKTGNLVKNIGKGAVMAIGAPMVAESMAEQARMQEQLRNQPKVTGDREKTPAEIIEDKRMARVERTAQLKKEERDDKQSKAMDMLKAKKDQLNKSLDAKDPAGRVSNNPLENALNQELSTIDEISKATGENMHDYFREKDKIIRDLEQPSTTADNYNQDFVPNQTSSGIIDRKLEQGSQIADETPNVAEVLSESQDSRQSVFADPEDVQNQMQSDMQGSDLGKNQLAKFLSQKGLDQALLGAIGERMTPEPRIGDSSPLLDHPDIIGGEDDGNLPSGMNTGSTQDLSGFYKEMRRMDAMERNKQAIDEIVEKTLTPSEKQVGRSPNELAGKDQAAFKAIQAGAGIPKEEQEAAGMRLKAKAAKKRAQSTSEKADDFTAKFVEGSQSDIVRGRRGNRSLGITRIPATNGDAQVGFVLANKPLDKNPTYATTYGFGVAPGAESLLDNQLNQESFSDYMQRGLGEAKEGKKRKAGEIFEFLPPSARVVSGTARLGDIVM